MKNEDLQMMGATPWRGDARPKDKGGRATFKSATAAAQAARAACAEARSAVDAVAHCRKMAEDAEGVAVSYAVAARRAMWLAVAVHAVALAVWAVLLC